METSDLFWYDDISVIWKNERLTEFFPTKEQSLEERLNSLVRLCLYCALILFFYHNEYKYLSIFIGSLLFTYFIYKNKSTLNKNDVNLKQKDSIISQPSQLLPDKIEKIETLENESCTVPTLDNPFMNATMKDYTNIDPKTGKIIDRPPACDINNPKIKLQMDNMFNNNLYRDVNDLFGKFNSQRQFYTMPSTTIPSDRETFQKWLYLNPKTCKEDQDFCLKYEDIRNNKPVMYNPNENPVNTKRLEK
jgi:hypothetical protein